MKMEKTRVPGVYARGTRYVAVWRDPEGVQRKKSFRTQGEAKAHKQAREAAVHLGEYQPDSRKLLRDYASEWKPQVRENTASGYERSLRLYVLEYFGPRVRLTDIAPHHVAAFYRWMQDKGCGQSVIAYAKATLSALMRSAREEGLIRTNPVLGVSMPREVTKPSDDDHENHKVKVFTDEQLQCVLTVLPAKHTLLFELLACTGLRISEALALEWRHLQLGSDPHVKVRRAYVRGDLGPPKSKHGVRDVALPFSLVRKLRNDRNKLSIDHGLVFPSDTGHHMTDKGLRSVLRPALEEAGCSWAGFHTFRHTYASMQIRAGVQVVPLSRAMGHHAASFTLDTYAHLMAGDEAPALEIDTRGLPMTAEETPQEKYIRELNIKIAEGGMDKHFTEHIDRIMEEDTEVLQRLKGVDS